MGGGGGGSHNLIGIVEPARAITVHVTWHMNTHGNT